MAENELSLVDEESDNKAKFEVRDVHHEDEKFTGVNRRIAQRRSGMDRRTGLRWEPDKDNRRSGSDRRESENDKDMWDRRDF